MRLTVITPLSASGNPYIEETYFSLVAQTLAEWEWVIVPNNGGVVPPHIPAGDPRVRVCPPPPELSGIGALKRYAAGCAASDSGVIVELDHDDLLTPVALERIAWAVVHDEADFVYSDFAQFEVRAPDEFWIAHVFGEEFGWSSYSTSYTDVNGVPRLLSAMRAPVITPDAPQALRRIEWAPNHVRAWRAEFYRWIGGHNPALPVADDFDLVLRTFFARGNMVHIPLCLYLYRVHAAQTVAQPEKNAAIQEATARLYDGSIEKLALRFCEANNLKAIDLCGGINTRPGFEPADLSTGVDLNGRWPWPDNSVGVLRAADALEHLSDPTHVMAEAYRVLAPGGFFLTLTPSTEGRGAWCDPTHVSFFNELSFRYYTDSNAQRYIAHVWGAARERKCGLVLDAVTNPDHWDAEARNFKPSAYLPPPVAPRFATSLLRTLFPSEWHKENGLVYAEWHGIALKPGYHHMGECDPSWRAKCAPALLLAEDFTPPQEESDSEAATDSARPAAAVDCT